MQKGGNSMKEAKGKEKLSDIVAILENLLERENKRKADYEDALKGYKVKEFENALLKEEAELQKTYPEFSLEKELSNNVFKKLVEAGLDMKTAFEAVHLKDVLSKGEKKDAPKKKRPVENGSVGTDSAIFKSGVYALSKKDRQELAKRAQRGEIIRL